MFRILKKKVVAIPVAVLAAATISGLAYAYWTTTGGGTATGGTGDAVALTIAQDGVVADMVPGGDAQPVNYTVTNSADTPQYVTTITINKVNVTYLEAAGTGTGGGSVANHGIGDVATACLMADFIVVQPEAVGLDLPVSTTSFTFDDGTTYENRLSGTVRLQNTGINQDGCKKTQLNLTFTAV